MPIANDQLQQILEKIRALESRYGRPEGSVRLLAVSKKKPLTDIKIAYEQGQREFGENYLQEAEQKIHENTLEDIVWHFIGPIQSNKTRPIAENFSWVHSLDRMKIAERLNQARGTEQEPLNVCIQVNISAEQSKSGITLDTLEEFAAKVHHLPQLHLRGIMALPRPSASFEQQCQQFKPLYAAYQKLQTRYDDIDTLSMGTSQDLEAAIAEGSTMVRIGTALFGQRD